MIANLPPMRPEVVAAIRNAEGKKYAFAAIREADGVGWALFTSQNNVHMFQNQCFDTEEEAIAGGLEWISTLPPESIKGP